jgi:hypothetical protein
MISPHANATELAVATWFQLYVCGSKGLWNEYNGSCLSADKLKLKAAPARVVPTVGKSAACAS